MGIKTTHYNCLIIIHSHMQKYEVIIIGAGPAGCECARQLSKAGRRILLVEKSKDFSINNYSSGSTHLDILKNFHLPNSIISSFWNKISLHTSHNEYHWKSSQPHGVVLDFMKLRQFLADEAVKHGGQLYLDCSYYGHENKDDKTLVHLKHHNTTTIETVLTDVLVDATGAERSVLAKDNYNKGNALAATGIEYHVDVDTKTFQQYDHKLSFFMGQGWMPQGYAWVFPIKPNQLKIGVIRYFLHQHIVPHDPSIRHYMDIVIKKCLGTSHPNIQEKHGKTLFYTYGQRDRLFDDNVIAVGDSISTLNPLASEGIRHAMMSGNIAAKRIISYIDRQQGFDAYRADMQKYFGFKWRLSEAIMNRLYREPNDHKLDILLEAFKKFSMQEVLELGFDYRFSKAAKLFKNYTLLNATDKIKSWF